MLTRPAWREAIAATPDVQVHSGEGPAEDLRAIAGIAAAAGGPLVVAYADIVTQREVLAGLLAEPKIRTGVLTTGGNAARPFGFKTRSNRGRIVSAGSPYHAVRRPTGTFLGVLKVAPADRPGVAPVAEQLAALVEPAPPADWQEELDHKAGHWHRMLALFAARERGEEAPEREALDAAALSPEDAAELERRRAIAPDDVTALLLVGVIRSGVHVGASRLRSLFWARPGSPAALERAREEIVEHDEDRELLNSAVKGADGFFTTFFVSTYSKYIARWAARRGLTPNQVTMFSIAVGVVAAACFAYAERWSMVVGGGARVLRVRLRLRRRPARPLHAPVLQARRLARLDLRPHEGVRRVRRPGDRREPHRRPGVGPRVRRAGAADHAPRRRLLVPRLPAPGDRRRRRSRRSRTRSTARARPRG